MLGIVLGVVAQVVGGLGGPGGLTTAYQRIRLSLLLPLLLLRILNIRLYVVSVEAIQGIPK